MQVLSNKEIIPSVGQTYQLNQMEVVITNIYSSSEAPADVVAHWMIESKEDDRYYNLITDYFIEGTADAKRIYFVRNNAYEWVSITYPHLSLKQCGKLIVRKEF